VGDPQVRKFLFSVFILRGKADFSVKDFRRDFKREAFLSSMGSQNGISSFFFRDFISL
jgi:hypothetical protein